MLQRSAAGCSSFHGVMSMLSIDGCIYQKGSIIYATKDGTQQARDDVQRWNALQLLQQVQADVQDIGCRV